MSKIENTPIQAQAFAKLRRLKVGALFMSMGTGKTKVALDLMADRVDRCDYFLWICPCSLKSEIEKEQQKWQPNLPLKVIGCESIGQSERIYNELLEELKPFHNLFVVVDESLKIKNLQAKRTKRIIEIGSMAQYKLILNGTPMSKNVLDVYSQMEFLSPLILNENYWSFRNKYCSYFSEGKNIGMILDQYNIPHLISRIQPYIFDAKLELDVQKNYQTVFYDLTFDDLNEYEKLKNKYFDELDKLEEKTSKIENNTELDPEEQLKKKQEERNSVMNLITLCHSCLSCSASRSLAIEKLLEKIDGKVVIFTKFLGGIPKSALKIIGSMNKEQREKELEKFKKTNAKCLYLSYGCGAFGLNLQFCHNIIFADRTWDMAQMQQAEARVYRLGQKADTVNYYYLKAQDIGLEELLDQNLERKEDVMDHIVTNLKKLKVKDQVSWLKKHI